MSLDFAFTVEIDRIPASGGHYDLTASPEQRAAAATRLEVTEVKALTGHFTVKIDLAGITRVEGSVHAELVQACVVSLAPLPVVIDEKIEAAFVSAERAGRKKHKDPEEEEFVGLDGDDPPEIAEGGRIDLGELAITQVALVLDPYPRAPGVAFDPRAAGLKAADIAEAEPAGPFAALAKLKKSQPN